MNKEELVQIRYKVIADYPDNKNAVGSIIVITQAGTKEAENLVCGWYDRFPAIYKRLQWWEERKIEDMSEYIMFSKDYANFKKGQVFKTEQWNKQHEAAGFCIGFITGPGKYDKCAVPASCGLLPATREEYEQYKQKEATNE